MDMHQNAEYYSRQIDYADELNDKLSAQIADLEKQLAEVRVERDSREEQRVDWMNKANELFNKTKELEAQLAHKDIELSDCERSIQGLIKNQDDMGVLNDRIAHLEAEIEKRDMDLADENANLRDRIVDLEAQLAENTARYDIMAEHMSEVKAYADGDRTNTLSDIVEHCVSELNGTDEQAKEA